MSEPSQLPHERRGAAFLVLLIAIGLAAVASLLLAPLEQMLPPIVADYRASVADRPVMAQSEPGSIRAQLPAAPPIRVSPLIG